MLLAEEYRNGNGFSDKISSEKLQTKRAQACDSLLHTMRRTFPLILLSIMACAPVILDASTFSPEGDTYPVEVGPDHRHLVTHGGSPYLVQGDAAWSLISGVTKEEAESYLEDRRREGSIPLLSTSSSINSMARLIVMKKSHLRCRAISPRRMKSTLHTQTGLFVRLLKKVFRSSSHLSIWDIRGETKDGSKKHWPTAPRSPWNWGRYVGKRYAGFDNIVWMIGGDRNPGEAREDVEAIVQGIKEFDRRHIMTAHCAPENQLLTNISKKAGWT